MQHFQYTGLPHRVLFGAGYVERLAAELRLAGIHRPVLLCSPRARAHIEKLLNSAGVALAATFDAVRMHVPQPTWQAAAALCNASQADGTVAFGGGSATGLAKMLARDQRLPFLAVPTTYSGSEMTPVWGFTQSNIKHTGRDNNVLPRAVIYDPALTLDLPAAIAASSGLNAMAHSAEALYAEDANPLINSVAEQSIRLLAKALPQIVSGPDRLAARSDALQGAWLAGLALGSVGMALHHKLCHVLGGSFGLDHGLTHSVVLPHALAYNRRAAPEALAAVARALNCEDGPSGLYQLARRLNVPAGLKDLGMAADRLDEAAALATENPYYNPAKVTRDGIRQLLEDAWHGRSPG
jgi:alcohol dehydrogenase class IV